MAKLSGNNGGMVLKMKNVVISMMLVVAVCWAIDIGGGAGNMVAAEVHHVVGYDPGWTTSSDLGSWLSGRVFVVGDTLWFAYSSASEGIMEVQTLEELMTCDLTNPINMYTNGLDKVSLDTQGTRFFTSSNLESCKNGLKLPVNVLAQPQGGYNIIKNQNLEQINDIVADGPASPSAAPHFTPTMLPFTLLLGLLPFYMGF